jgi:serine/threonine protein kinase
MVAVKTSLDTEGEGADELVREATVMAQVTGHKNLVALIGVVTSGAPLLLLVSLCDNGSVLDYVKEQKAGGSTVPVAVKQRMAFEIAAGMAHLAAARFIHRDLAARNVLVDSQVTCKVADFGLYGARFRQKLHSLSFTPLLRLKRCHACVTNDIPLVRPRLLPVDAVNSVQMLKVSRHYDRPTSPF